MVLGIQKLEDYKKALSQKDAILEPNIYNDALAEYIAEGGAPMDAVTLLAESYIGSPSMCNIIASSADSIGVDSQTVMREAIKQKLKERFDPKRCDDLLMQSENQVDPEWLSTIIKADYWRKTIYELLEQYPRCAFLNLAVMRISEAGYSEEISNLRTASTYIEVYNSILDHSFSSIVPVDDLEFEDRLPDIVRVCCEREETYLYAQLLLQNLYENEDKMPFIRLSQELERSAIQRGQHGFVDILKLYLSSAPTQVSNALKAIRSNQQATPGDIMVLYKLYSSDQPPAIQHIRDFELINIMLKTVFVPNSGTSLKPELKEKLLYLIAYATTNKDTNEIQKQEIDQVYNILKELQVALNEKAKGENMTGAMKTILKAISLPIGSMAVLLWIEYTSIHTPYFETYFRSSEVPVLHLLLDEIASRHPLQRPFVFEVIKTCLRHPYQNFAPEILMTLQKAWIDRLLYLVQVHYTLPVLKFIKSAERELDDSLTVHFVQKVLRMAKPPYSLAFVEHLADILLPITEMLGLIKNVPKAVVDFFDEARQEEQIVISETLDKKIASICSLKSKTK
ncbi:TH1 protein [Halteromyces radiatus]|uniref:TH1 protein n=1 Tax=Halteromyces radiatus TaxID=101107 RepID=UPI00221FC825|nr:TH1 protein [Halteromyces radiatus]KAI8097011.1 TH1 protein [Halteromyces radiatus]